MHCMVLYFEKQIGNIQGKIKCGIVCDKTHLKEEDFK